MWIIRLRHRITNCIHIYTGLNETERWHACAKASNSNRLYKEYYGSTKKNGIPISNVISKEFVKTLICDRVMDFCFFLLPEITYRMREL